MERLQKLLARAGVASRRQSEKLIAAGHVSVNGRIITELGTQADPEHDIITVSGNVISFAEAHYYLMLNKPAGVLSTRDDPQGRPIIMDLIPERFRSYVYPVGRLDMDAEGLLLLTNDGDLAHALTHPSFEIPKTYLVTVKKGFGEEELRALLDGVELEDGPAAADAAEIIRRDADTTLLSLTLHEGRKREVKRLCKAVGKSVLALQRIALGPLTLDTLKPGQYRHLTAEEVEQLHAATGLRRDGKRGQ
jgi:pseudouridine synthase